MHIVDTPRPADELRSHQGEMRPASLTAAGAGFADESAGRARDAGRAVSPAGTQMWQGRSTWSRLRDARGWTLIELVVVMGLIVVLAGIATAQYRNAVTRSREAVLKEDLFRMRDAIDQYYADKNKYPSDLQVLVSDGYMREVPRDPFTESAETWQTTPAEPDPANPSLEPGIYNVKSGSDRSSMDGTPYSDW